ncbi:MAG TPA: hypothetical protein VE077_12445 [Candidatus Methylomirabilis sp.]|nr:hypothetical protein [Candidatus Methylomirabilis sp.]
MNTKLSTEVNTTALPSRIEGFIGQDFLRTFSAVRIDYKAQTATLEVTPRKKRKTG